MSEVVAMKRVRFSWTLFEIGILALVFAVLLILSSFQNSFEERIGLGLLFLLAAFFLVAVSLTLRRIENARAKKKVHQRQMMTGTVL